MKELHCAPYTYRAIVTEKGILMRSLRYRLGLPLFNLILWAVCTYTVRLAYETELNGTLYAAAEFCFYVCFKYGGVFAIPLLTALFYPVWREDCRPLWKPAVISGAVIFAVSWLTLIAILCGASVFLFPLITIVSLLIALVETAGYSLGLLIAWGIYRAAERKKAASAQNTPTDEITI